MFSELLIVRALARIVAGVHVVAVVAAAFAVMAVATAMVSADVATAFYLLKYGLLTFVIAAVVARITGFFVEAGEATE